MAHIILADDDDIVACIAMEHFRNAGHDIQSYADGNLALAAIRSAKPDMAILDCAMPGLNGLLVLRAIRNLPELYDLPVLMLTARTSSMDVQLAFREKANAYVKKPFDPEFLVHRAEGLLFDAGRLEVSRPSERRNGIASPGVKRSVC